MNRLTSVTVMASVLAVGIACGIALHSGIRTSDAAVLQEAPSVTPAAKQLQESFNQAAEFAMKSVVHITTDSRPAPEDFSFQVPSQNIGSGVVISVEGHVLTNNHVVQGSRTCVVRFPDGREYRAEVRGTDPESDLALLAIEAKDEKFQPLAFADSDKVRVGDWVLAIGSPFGYNHSVSAGIVSAKHRVANMNQPYQDFIQTDAAINPGNSGGALVNLSGEVVAINAAIVSQSRAFEGIGLAISSNLAKWVSDRLLKEGRVRRGYLGIYMMDVDQDLVERLGNDGIQNVKDLCAELGIDSPHGAVVCNPDRRRHSLEAGSPADKAGVEFMDLIVEFDGKAIRNSKDLLFAVAACEPGRKVKLKVLRDRKAHDLELELSERPGTRRR